MTKKNLDHFMMDGMILNWRDIDKCYLILILGGLDVLLWILWWWGSFFITELHVWINFAFYPTLILVFSLLAAGFFILIILTKCLKNNRTYERCISYITVGYFGFLFIFGGYCIGILSPATIASYVSLVTVALLLFDRKIVYLTVIPITSIILICIGLTLTGKLAYAPAFSQYLQSMPLHTNHFWVYCMLYSYIPIFFTSIILFETLLTQWRKRERTIQQNSILDPLTGIFNRRKMSENLDELNQQGDGFSIVLLDLDHFKNINDTYGHQIGDIVLKRIAIILTEQIGEGDSVGRFGGEEYIILLKNKKIPDAIAVAERCRHAIDSDTIQLDYGQILDVTASFGVTTMRYPTLSNDEIIRQADQALYLAKRNGRNQVCHYFEIQATSLTDL